MSLKLEMEQAARRQDPQSDSDPPINRSLYYRGYEDGQSAILAAYQIPQETPEQVFQTLLKEWAHLLDNKADRNEWYKRWQAANGMTEKSH